MLRGVLWADTVVVGGGELVQDSSSLLYSPFNLLPFRLAAAFGKPSFAWLVGLGQGSELRPWTRKGLAGCLSLARGISVRDEPSGRLLSDLGLRRDRFLVAADSAFCLCRNRRPGPVLSDLLGAAPRDVSNRSGSLLPLETRRRLGLVRDVRDEGMADGWAALLDSHLERNGGRVLLLPFHTGSLSNSDDAMCASVQERMKHGEAVSILRDSSLEGYLDAMSGCRVMVSAPLHGAILSVVSGALPVAVPYSSKGARFMSEAGLGDLVVDCHDPGWWRRAADKVDEAWRTADVRWEALSVRREKLRASASANTAYFKSVCAL